MAADCVGIVCRFRGKCLCYFQWSWCADLVDVTAEEDVFGFLVLARFSPALADLFIAVFERIESPPLPWRCG